MQRKFYLGFQMAESTATVLSACGTTSSSSSAKQDLRVLADPSFYGESDISPEKRERRAYDHYPLHRAL